MHLLQSGMDFPSFYVSLSLDGFKESKLFILQDDLGDPQVWSIWCFFRTRCRPCIPHKKTPKMVLRSSQRITAGGTRCRTIPSLTVFTLIIWARVSASLHHKVTIFFFVTDEDFVEKYYETMPISCFSSNLHPPINNSCLHQSSLWCLPNGDFSIFYSPSTFIGWHSPVRKSCVSPAPIYLFTNVSSLNVTSCNALLSLFMWILPFPQIWLVRVPCTCFFRKQI